MHLRHYLPQTAATAAWQGGNRGNGGGKSPVDSSDQVSSLQSPFKAPDSLGMSSSSFTCMAKAASDDMDAAPSCVMARLTVLTDEQEETRVKISVKSSSSSVSGSRCVPGFAFAGTGREKARRSSELEAPCCCCNLDKSTSKPVSMVTSKLFLSSNSRVMVRAVSTMSCKSMEEVVSEEDHKSCARSEKNWAPKACFEDHLVFGERSNKHSR
mmetsp:Transcript_63107/g.176505  ORF Transcript_63107/g.176505 Transcript_63107/m.176505 type:complete len:212 (+) Transcript_63107:290-925(+)